MSAMVTVLFLFLLNFCIKSAMNVALTDVTCEAAGVKDPCENDAPCHVHHLPLVRPHKVIVLCQCHPAWTGNRCEKERDICELGEDTCGSGGLWKCERNASNIYSGYDCGCESRKGWQRLSASQPHCIDVDECSRLQPACQNGGTCINTIGNYKCQCAPGYYGRRCTSKSRSERAIGGWGPWSEWLPDGTGKQKRFRQCRHERLQCSGDISFVGSRCELKRAPLMPTRPPRAWWSSWNLWTECSAQCGTGTHTRQRLCVGQYKRRIDGLADGERMKKRRHSTDRHRKRHIIIANDLSMLLRTTTTRRSTTTTNTPPTNQAASKHRTSALCRPGEKQERKRPCKGPCHQLPPSPDQQSASPTGANSAEHLLRWLRKLPRQRVEQLSAEGQLQQLIQHFDNNTQTRVKARLYDITSA